jgi:hypothetical protein
MRKTCKFAKRILIFAKSAEISEGTWRKLCSDVIDPVLEEIASDSKTIVIDGERHNVYSDCIPVGDEDDKFAKNITPEIAYELFLAQREYESVARSYDGMLNDPPFEKTEAIAKRLSEGVSQIDELNRFLVLADAFVETADEFLDDVKPILIGKLLCLAMNIYTHCMLLAPLDFDSSITSCGEITRHCTEQRKAIDKLTSGKHINAIEEAPVNAEPEGVTPTSEELAAEAPVTEDPISEAPMTEMNENESQPPGEKEDEDGFEFVEKAAEKLQFVATKDSSDDDLVGDTEDAASDLGDNGSFA